MTVENLTRRSAYTGNGVTTTFATTFQFFELFATINGVEVLPSTYTIIQASAGGLGSVQFTVAPAAGAAIILASRTVPKQLTDYVENDSFPAATHELALDRVTMAVQDTVSTIGRSVRAPEDAAAVPPVNFAANPSTLLTVNASGQPAAINPNTEDTVWYNAIAAAVSRLLGYATDGVSTLLVALQTKFKFQRNVMTYIPTALHASIQNHTCATDLTVYLQAALDDMGQYGDTLHWPRGYYPFDSTLMMAGKTNRRMRGEGGNYDLNIDGGTVLHYRGTGFGRGIDASNARSCSWSEMSIVYSDSFTGHLVDISTPYDGFSVGNKHSFSGVYLYQYGVTFTAMSLINAYGCVDFTFTGGRMARSRWGIIGAPVSAVTIAQVSSRAVVTWPDHELTANQQIGFSNFTGALPAPLNAFTDYYVRNVLTDGTFTVSATVGGAEISLSTVGTGKHYCSWHWKVDGPHIQDTIHAYIGSTSDFVYCTEACVGNPGLRWEFHEVNFEPAPSGVPSGIIVYGNNRCVSVTVSGSTYSDAVTAGTWNDFGLYPYNLVFENNSVAGDGVSAVVGVRFRGANGGSVSKNYFSFVGTAIDMTGAGSSGLSSQFNSFNSSVTANLTGSEWGDITCDFSGNYPDAIPVLATVAGTNKVKLFDESTSRWSYATAAQVSAVSSLNAFTGFRNKLVNGQMLVNQRAVSTAADDTYCFDRWYALTSSLSVGISSVSGIEDGWDKALRITQGNATSIRIGLAQIVESAEAVPLIGATVTASARVRKSSAGTIRCAVLAWTGAADAVTSDVINSWPSVNYTPNFFFNAANLALVASGSVTVTANVPYTVQATGVVPAGTTNLIMVYWVESPQVQTTTWDIGKCQLEENSIPTPCEEVPLSVEMERCRRFYWRAAAAAQDPVGAGQATAATQSQVMLRFPTPMRAAPAMVLSAAGDFSTTNGAGSWIAATALTTTAKAEAAILTATVAAGLTLGHGSYLLATGATPNMAFDAEL